MPGACSRRASASRTRGCSPSAPVLHRSIFGGVLVLDGVVQLTGGAFSLRPRFAAPTAPDRHPEPDGSTNECEFFTAGGPSGGGAPATDGAARRLPSGAAAWLNGKLRPLARIRRR
jgi:hypothetical protein